MVKERYSPRGFPFELNATTVGPQVARTITSDQALEERTLAGILDHGGARLRLFRQSSMEHDLLSCEVYARLGDEWVLQRKEGVKYVPPQEFLGKRVDIDGVPFWSVEDLSARQLELLRSLVRRKTS
jgi:hypothetical protein